MTVYFNLSITAMVAATALGAIVSAPRTKAVIDLAGLMAGLFSLLLLGVKLFA